MGQEIASGRFAAEDFAEFEHRLRRETRLLEGWFRDRVFSDAAPGVGFELEAWLVDRQGFPASINEALLDNLGHPQVVSELARFNIELNGLPELLQGDLFSRLHRQLDGLWHQCHRAAARQGARALMVGILPSARHADFNLGNMSPRQRYFALDRQLLQLRTGRSLMIDIAGRERLQFTHDDVMLESATTSFQVHLQVGQDEAVRSYNASLIASAPLLAVAANSSYLFGSDLWDETRIPLFEQAVQAGESALGQRVTFGVDYLRSSLMEMFQANLDHYPVLLPDCMQTSEADLAHLSLHNGTIWRWNRPLVGFDRAGVPHLRIEHRALPSGPTPVDAIANLAFYLGLVSALRLAMEAPEQRMPFAVTRDNFYTAAQHGLEARISWLDGATGPVHALIQRRLLPLAAVGLQRLGLARSDFQEWLAIIAGRLEKGQTGAVWQRRWVDLHGCNMPALVEAYYHRQVQGDPVHTWSL